VDEDGILFWGGSRRRPVPLTFDPNDSAHRSFVLWAAVLRGRAFGQKSLRSPEDPRLLTSYNTLTLEILPSQYYDNESMVCSQLTGMTCHKREELLGLLRTEEFEKDDAELGHVDFATAAANLRLGVGVGLGVG
jgi:hypothetical protein